MSQLCILERPEDTANSIPIDPKEHWTAVGHRKSDASESAAGINAVAVETTSATPVLTALSVEFVAAPGEAKQVRETIPADVDAAFQVVDGYVGCMVLVSDQEARLVTVITLWSGADRSKRCNENTKWVKRLLTPYVDRWLRTQTLVTSLKGMQQFPLVVGR